jgi:hypothetical protein
MQSLEKVLNQRFKLSNKSLHLHLNMSKALLEENNNLFLKIQSP